MDNIDIKSESSNSSSEGEYDDVNEDECEPTTCLFCLMVFKNIELAIEHLQKEHHLSLHDLQKKFQMDQYSFLKCINYIRSKKVSVEVLLETKKVLWDDEKYLKPVEYEPWLCYDYEVFMTDTQPTVQDLLHRIAEQKKLLLQANADMEQMRKSYKTLMKSDDKNQKINPSKNCVRNSKRLDNEYFSSYAHFGIHHDMLSDKVRTSSYRNSLLKNVEFVRDKTVLDVGCGTGILSIFASQAGAKNVIGIDNSEIVYSAIDIVRKNGIQNVQLFKGRLEDTELPQSKYDIIISEWMGYFLLYEGMLDSIIYARENHLSPNGIILPNRCTLSIVGYGNDFLYKDHIDFWSNVYGIDMCELRKRSIEEPLIEVVEPQFILTDAEQIANFDMMTVDMNYSSFTHEFNLECKKSGNLSAFVGYFNTYFELPTAVMFGTAPTDTPTHWKQTVFFIDQPQLVSEGDFISGKITSRRQRNDIRALHISIEVFGKCCKYNLS